MDICKESLLVKVQYLGNFVKASVDFFEPFFLCEVVFEIGLFYISVLS